MLDWDKLSLGLDRRIPEYSSCCLVMDMMNRELDRGKSQALHSLRLAMYNHFQVSNKGLYMYRPAYSSWVSNR